MGVDPMVALRRNDGPERVLETAQGRHLNRAAER
jgi:hypothetical protein